MNFDLTAFFVYVTLTTVSGVLARHGVMSMPDAQRALFIVVRIVAGVAVAFVAPVAGMGWWQVGLLLLIREVAAIIDYIITRAWAGHRVRSEATECLRSLGLEDGTGGRKQPRRLTQRQRRSG